MPTLTELVTHRAEPSLHPAVRTAVEIMRTRYAEPITLNDLAAEVYVSPFHFSRMFAKATGATPGRFLTAVRMFEAKQLLLTTSMTVSDIVCSVGYSSVGTFTSRFSRAVGMSPSQYRTAEVRDLMVAVEPDRAVMPSATAMTDAAADQGGDGGSVTARVELPRALGPATLLVGVFDEPIPQCGPVAFTCVEQTGSTTVTLDGVPGGSRPVLAVALHPTDDPDRPVVSMGTSRRRVSGDADGSAFTTVRLRPVPSTMPPIAFTLAATAARPALPVAAASATARPAALSAAA